MLIDQVVAVEVELFDRRREERQVVRDRARPTNGSRWMSDGVTSAALDRAATIVPGMWTSVKRSAAGKSSQKTLERLLAPAHAGEPVVDERDAQEVII